MPAPPGTARRGEPGAAPGRPQAGDRARPRSRARVRREVGRCDVADRAVEPDRVVVLHESSDDGTRLIERRRLAGADGVGLDGLVVALELAIRLRVVRGRPDVRHPREPDELLEVLRDELRAVVRDHARRLAGVSRGRAARCTRRPPRSSPRGSSSARWHGSLRRGSSTGSRRCPPGSGRRCRCATTQTYSDDQKFSHRPRSAFWLRARSL